MEKEKETSIIRIFVDGSGARPDGKGSCFAFYRSDTGESSIECVNGLSNNQAEYRAVLLALNSVAEGSEIEILCDSQLVVCQFNRDWRVLDPNLALLLTQVRELIHERRLTVTATWIPRAQNVAGELI
jgi:ribonuclease HI